MKFKFKKWYEWRPFIAYRDIQNYLDWIKIIKKEEKDPKSKYNFFKLNHSTFYTLYIQTSLEDGDEQLPIEMQKAKLIEYLAPIHRYLDEDLGFAEYIVPEFNQFYVEGKPTLTYGVMYIFAFKQLSLRYILKYLVFIGLTLFVILRYGQTILNWL
jgi:hypothetical protein